MMKRSSCVRSNGGITVLARALSSLSLRLPTDAFTSASARRFVWRSAKYCVSVVRVMDQSTGVLGLSGVDCLFEGIEQEVGLHAQAHPSAHDPSGVAPLIKAA